MAKLDNIGGLRRYFLLNALVSVNKVTKEFTKSKDSYSHTTFNNIDRKIT